MTTTRKLLAAIRTNIGEVLISAFLIAITIYGLCCYGSIIWRHPITLILLPLLLITVHNIIEDYREKTSKDGGE